MTNSCISSALRVQAREKRASLFCIIVCWHRSVSGLVEARRFEATVGHVGRSYATINQHEAAPWQACRGLAVFTRCASCRCRIDLCPWCDG